MPRGLPERRGPVNGGDLAMNDWLSREVDDSGLTFP